MKILNNQFFRKTKSICIAVLLFLGTCNVAFADFEETKKLLAEALARGENITVLLVDMQKYYLKDAELCCWFDKEYNDVSKELEQLIAYAGENGLNVINVVTERKQIPKFGVRPQYDTETVLDGLKNIKYKTYYKITSDAFNEESKRYISKTAENTEDIVKNIADELKLTGTNGVFVAGCYDGDCVFNTTTGALGEGYTAYTDRDMNILFSEEYVKNLHAFKSATVVENYVDEQWDILKNKNPRLTVVDKKETKIEKYRETFNKPFQCMKK